MKLEIPGQMRGPECHRVMLQAIALRKEMEPWFGALVSTRVSKLTVVLRVDGSLGTFGSAGVQNIEQDGIEVACDLVITDRGWENLSDGEIRGFLLREISGAVEACFESCHVPFVRQEFEANFGRAAA